MKRNPNPLFVAAALLAAASCGQSGTDTAAVWTTIAPADSLSVFTVSVGADGVSVFDGQVQDRAPGTFTLSWIKDNPGERHMSVSLFPTAPQDLIDSLGLSAGIPSSVGTFLAVTDDGIILFDTGNGDADSQLLPGLESLGLVPEDVDYVYLTHFHGDHIAGMLSGEEQVFPNATVYAPKAEYDAWMAMPEDRKALVVKTMGAYSDRLHLFAAGDTLPGAFTALPAYGHTPGHTLYRQGSLLIIGDLMHGAALQTLDPTVNATFDMDGEAAARVRAEYLELAEEAGLTIAGMHLPAPGFMVYR